MSDEDQRTHDGDERLPMHEPPLPLSHFTIPGVTYHTLQEGATERLRLAVFVEGDLRQFELSQERFATFDPSESAAIGAEIARLLAHPATTNQVIGMWRLAYRPGRRLTITHILDAEQAVTLDEATMARLATVLAGGEAHQKEKGELQRRLQEQYAPYPPTLAEREAETRAASEAMTEPPLPQFFQEELTDEEDDTQGEEGKGDGDDA